MTKLIKSKISETRRKLRKFIYPYLIILLFLTTLTFGILSVKAAAPSIPSGLSATAVSYSQINLSWSDVSGETRYELQRAPSGGQFSTIAPNISDGTTTYQDTGLNPSTTYYYWIRACNADGCSGYSNYVNATTPAAPPAAPSGLRGTSPSGSQINLSWTDNSNNEQGFKVERSNSSSGPFTQVAATGANVTTYSQIGLTSGTTYYYRVKAYNYAGDSAYAGPIGVTTLTTIPTAPSNLRISGTPAYNQIAIYWSDNSSNEQGFKVERALSSSGPFTQIGTTAAGTANYQDTTVSPVTTYYYRVRAYNTAGNSAYTLTVSAATPAAPPTAPSNLLSVGISHNQINLTWIDRSTNEISFVLERSASESFPTGSVTAVTINSTTTAATGGTISYSDTASLSEATSYYYRVYAKSSETVKSGYSNTSSTSTKLLAPNTLTAELIQSPITVNLTWRDISTREENFIVEKSITSATDGFTQLAELPANITTYSDDYPDQLKTIYYRVYAKTATLTSLPTNVVNVTTPERINLQRLATTPVIGEATDVAISGNYAHVTSSTGLQMVDVANPANPLVKASLNLVSPYALATNGNDYIYVGTSNQIRVVMVETVNNRKKLSLVNTVDTGGFVHDLDISENYLYVANYSSGMKIYDITNPQNPILAGSLADPNGQAVGISVNGNIAVLANGTAGVKIIDVVTKSNPRSIGSYAAGDTVAGVDATPGRAYIAAKQAGMQILDISTPSSPQKIYQSTLPYSFAGISVEGNRAYASCSSEGSTGNGLQVFNLNDASTQALPFVDNKGRNRSGVAFTNNSAFVAAGYGGLSVIDTQNITSSSTPIATLAQTLESPDLVVDGNYLYAMSHNWIVSRIYIYDISNPSMPEHIASYATGQNLHALFKSGSYLYATIGKKLEIINVSNPTNPTLTGSVDLPSLPSGNNDGYKLTISAVNKKAYIARYLTGMSIVDITNPSSPVYLATFDTPGQANGVEVVGSKAYVADGTSGLQVINVTNPSSPSILGSCTTECSGARSVTIQNNVAFLAAPMEGMIIVDISTNNPTFISKTIIGLPPINIVVSGDYAYVALSSTYLANRVQVFNISNLANPTSVAFHETQSYTRSIANRGRYIYAASDKHLIEIFDLHYDRPNVEKKASVTSQTRGGEITYTLTITNPTPYQLTGLNLSDDVPLGTTFIEASNGVQPINGNITWDLGDIPARQQGVDGKLEVSFKVRVN